MPENLVIREAMDTMTDSKLDDMQYVVLDILLVRVRLPEILRLRLSWGHVLELKLTLTAPVAAG